ncbi:biotin transport system permease protein [Pararhizobium capsulatum DSM 1112]|uniref:Biotin transport system permease protein n=1 Tax=Pararhizobium capsulatum DSM 1112 TaxID=1121113 RepID=A0ABU0BP20_9HYPH|nr:energy-coupling factor transporter transmembrane protein EcfT [Pararhizobium capsulatum]MDQ0319416.1 biotin transport system permease protein [Pararhizobium capsulatum DSM 1112]
MLKSLYVEGRTPLHAMSVRTKLVMLMAASIVLFFVTSPLALLPVFILCAATYFTLGLPLREAFGRVGWVLFAILILALATLYFDGARQAAAMALRIGAVVFLASAITATTAISAFMDEITILLQPFERAGILRAADVGLALALVIRFVPEILDRYANIREAHRARGLPMRPLTLFAPLIIQTLKDADTIAMAIDARGFRRQ